MVLLWRLLKTVDSFLREAGYGARNSPNYRQWRTGLNKLHDRPVAVIVRRDCVRQDSKSCEEGHFREGLFGF